MQTASLFRQAASDRAQTKFLGEIVLIQPISFTFLTSIVVGMAAFLVAFLSMGQYTRHSSVTGQLMPNTGILNIYVPQTGIITRKLVQEGQVVKKGQALFVISSERRYNNIGVEASASRQLLLRQQSLRDEISRLRNLQTEEIKTLRKKVDSLQMEQSKITQQIAGQSTRVELAATAFDRALSLLNQGYVSTDMAQQKEAELLDQRNRLVTLERERRSLDREIAGQLDELASLPLKQKNDVGQLERLLGNTVQEWTENEGKRQTSVIATEDGIVTAIIADVGQTADPSRALASIIPANAILVAHLFAPSRAMGFVHENDRVLLRYQAYPYQKFGHGSGRVDSISRVSISRDAQANSLSNGAAGEQFYRITVLLNRQTITAYGKEQPLQAGMQVEADIMQERRRLYEWVLDPLFSLSGKL